LANIFWLSAIKNGSGLARGAIIFSVASALIATILGIYFYNESTNKIQMIGMLLGVVSLILIFWE
jgi:glucose uptake protein GlcU